MKTVRSSSPGIGHRIIASIGFLCFSLVMNSNGQENRNFPSAASPTPHPQKAPADAISKTVVEMTAVELHQFLRKELKYLKFNESQDPLDNLLKRAGDRVVAFCRDFSNASAKELIEMSRSYAYASGYTALEASRVAEYRYLILPGSGISWVEDRTDKKSRSLNPQKLQGFIITWGYAGQCIYLHPSHQANSHFRYLGRETRKPYALVVAFAQKPEAGDYLVQYTDPSSSTPTRYLVQGFVWLHPDSFEILRLRTSMLLPDREIPLKNTISDTHYGKVQFDNPRREFWLPEKIDVTLEFPVKDGIRVYRNSHKYSDYQFFTVNTDYKIVQPKVDE